MLPLILTNAFKRPRGTRTSAGVSVCEKTNVYACIEELIDEVIVGRIGAQPILLPTAFDPASLEALLQHVDGILLPGAVSNVHPACYGGSVEVTPQTFDPAHDETDLFLIRAAARLGVPFLGICRAMQMMNVAFGGTLSQSLPDKGVDHYCSGPCDGHDPAPAFMHDAQIEAGGLFEALFQTQTIQVNSLHEQAIARVGEGLRIEARAPDGVIEALSWRDPACPENPPFFVGVQGHPEALPTHPVSLTLFEAFTRSVKERAKR